MGRWVLYVSVGILLYVLLACTANNKMHRDNSEKKTHEIDSLPTTIIQEHIEQPDSIVYIDTSSTIKDCDYILAVMASSDEVSAKPRFLQENVIVNQFSKLRHTEFKEIELAIDANGNIIYLDRDF